MSQTGSIICLQRHIFVKISISGANNSIIVSQESGRCIDVLSHSVYTSVDVRLHLKPCSLPFMLEQGIETL